jgi:aconitate hydratase
VELARLAPESPVSGVIRHSDGTTESFTASHTMSAEHIAWFEAGGALNLIRAKQAD